MGIFYIKTESVDFARWEIYINSLFFGISAIATFWWFYICKTNFNYRSHQSEEEMSGNISDTYNIHLSNSESKITMKKSCGCIPWPYTGDQEWVAKLAIGLIFYNQPFYFGYYVKD